MGIEYGVVWGAVGLALVFAIFLFGAWKERRDHRRSARLRPHKRNDW